MVVPPGSDATEFTDGGPALNHHIMVSTFLSSVMLQSFTRMALNNHIISCTSFTQSVALSLGRQWVLSEIHPSSHKYY